ncbi:hypothetical protein Tco_0953978 [Tanacetum coccineum]|uniref:DNA-directed RNA polymerase n=1 Tax=Tanacetum coccineum TaxID=301880 RepID=A0ABQ5E1R5_9ASTR
MDVRSDVYVLSNGCRKSSDTTIIGSMHQYFIHLFLYIEGMVFSYGCKAEIWVTKGLLVKAKRNILGLEIIRDQSGNTLRVSQSKIHNEKLVQTLLKGHSTLSLEDSLSGDCDVKKMAWKKEAIWLTGLLEELSVKLKSMAVNCDNQDAIHLSRNHVFHERTKHINVRYYFIIEVLEAKTVEVLKVGTEHNVVDALTKVVAGHKLLGVAECEYEELPDGETEIVPLACHLGHDIQIQSGREELCLIIGLSRLVSTFGGQDMALKELMQKNAVHNEMYNKMNTFMLDMQLGMMPPDQRNVLWSSQYRSSHNSDVGGVILNVMNQERREVHPSMYVLSPYTLLLPTTILPKKWGDKSRNKGMNANVAPFNLGKAVVDDNVVDEEVPITGERDTNDYIFYENMDPSKVIVRGVYADKCQRESLGDGCNKLTQDKTMPPNAT